MSDQRNDRMDDGNKKTQCPPIPQLQPKIKNGNDNYVKFNLGILIQDPGEIESNDSVSWEEKWI